MNTLLDADSSGRGLVGIMEDAKLRLFESSHLGSC